MITSDIIFLLAFFGLFQGVLISFYFLLRKDSWNKGFTFLGLAVLGITIRVAKSVLGYHVSLQPWQGNIGIAGILLASPMLYLFGLRLFKKESLAQISTYLHLAPLFLFVCCIPFIPLKGTFNTFWNYGISVLCLGMYLTLSFRLLQTHGSKSARQVFVWYRSILVGTTVICGFYFSNLLNVGIHYLSGPIFYAFLIYGFSYLVLSQKHLPIYKYEASKLDKVASGVLFKKIETAFQKELLFQNPKVSLQLVANKLHTSSRSVSQAINENTEQNFHEFVNHFRVQKAKKLMDQSEYLNEKIAVIAFEVGFSNITSFNTAFKKFTQLTPSEYRKGNSKLENRFKKHEPFRI